MSLNIRLPADDPATWLGPPWTVYNWQDVGDKHDWLDFGFFQNGSIDIVGNGHCYYNNIVATEEVARSIYAVQKIDHASSPSTPIGIACAVTLSKENFFDFGGGLVFYDSRPTALACAHFSHNSFVEEIPDPLAAPVAFGGQTIPSRNTIGRNNKFKKISMLSASLITAQLGALATIFFPIASTFAEDYFVGEMVTGATSGAAGTIVIIDTTAFLPNIVVAMSNFGPNDEEFTAGENIDGGQGGASHPAFSVSSVGDFSEEGAPTYALGKYVPLDGCNTTVYLKAINTGSNPGDSERISKYNMYYSLDGVSWNEWGFVNHAAGELLKIDHIGFGFWTKKTDFIVSEGGISFDWVAIS